MPPVVGAYVRSVGPCHDLTGCVVSVDSSLFSFRIRDVYGHMHDVPDEPLGTYHPEQGWEVLEWVSKIRIYLRTLTRVELLMED